MLQLYLEQNFRICRKKFPFQGSFFLNKTVFGLLHFCLLLNLSDETLLVKQLLRQLPMVRRFETRLMVLEYVINDWQNFQNFCFLMRNLFQKLLILLSRGEAVNLLFKTTFILFFLRFFTYPLDFFLFWQFEPWISWKLLFYFWISSYFLSTLQMFWMLVITSISLLFRSFISVK